MPLAFRMFQLSFGTLCLSAVIGFLQAPFGMPHVILASVAGAVPIVYFVVFTKMAEEKAKEADTIAHFEQKLRVLEGEISKINLAIKLRN